MVKALDLDGIEELTGAKLTSVVDDPFTFHTLTWDDGDFCTMYRNGDDLHFHMLVSQSGKNRLYQLVSTLPAFFRERGIERFTTTGSDATEGMLHVGFEDDGGFLVHPIHEGCRMDQYAAQKRDLDG